jgi:hypothetical protein
VADPADVEKLSNILQRAVQGVYSDSEVRMMIRYVLQIAQVLAKAGVPHVRYSHAKFARALRALLGADLENVSYASYTGPFGGIPTLAVLEQTPAEDIDELYSYCLLGLGDFPNLKAGESPQLFATSMQDIANGADVDSDAAFIRTRLSVYDSYLNSLDAKVEYEAETVMYVAVGQSPESVPGKRPLGPFHRIVDPTDPKLKAHTTKSADGDHDEIPLYKAVELPLRTKRYIAIGQPRTLTDLLEDKNVTTIMKSGMVRYCRRLEAIMQVGYDPSALLFVEMSNTPGEVLAGLLDYRIAVGHNLTIDEFRYFGDAHEIEF